MDTSNYFLFHLKYNDDYKPFAYNGNLDNLKEAYILCKYSFMEKNFDVANLING